MGKDLGGLVRPSLDVNSVVNVADKLLTQLIKLYVGLCGRNFTSNAQSSVGTSAGKTAHVALEMEDLHVPEHRN